GALHVRTNEGLFEAHAAGSELAQDALHLLVHVHQALCEGSTGSNDAAGDVGEARASLVNHAPAGGYRTWIHPQHPHPQTLVNRARESCSGRFAPRTPFAELRLTSCAAVGGHAALSRSSSSCEMSAFAATLCTSS